MHPNTPESGREKKADRRVQYTKMFLKDALLRLMKEKPIGKITPTELCREADINRNTFYAHYQSPLDLLHEIEAELSEEIMSCVTIYVEDTLRMNEICRAVQEHADVCTVILSDHGDRDFLLQLLNYAHDMTIAEWSARAPDIGKEELERFFTYCANGSVAVILEWVHEGMKTPADDIAEMLEIANAAALIAMEKTKGTLPDHVAPDRIPRVMARIMGHDDGNKPAGSDKS